MKLSSLTGGQMPDVTPAQIAAVVTWVVAQLVAFGIVDSARAQLLISLGSTVVAAAWKIADAYLRGQRARAVAQGAPALLQEKVGQ